MQSNETAINKVDKSYNDENSFGGVSTLYWRATDRVTHV